MSEQKQDSPSVEPTATTTMTKDYMGRALTTPATAGKDFLGRAIQAGDKDYLGRTLLA